MYLVSVIIPVYNAGPWLEECLQSILGSVGQEAGDVELVLINDGSTDNSGAICDRYASEHPHIRVFHKENGGVSTARNLGLARAQGRYLAWVDPDDYVSADWFPKIREAIGRGGPDVIVMDSVRFGAGPDRQEVYGREAGFVDRDLFVSDVLRDIRMLSGMPNKVMKAYLFRGVTFDPALPILEDYAAIPGILKNAETVYYIPHALYHYRQHPDSLLHEVSPERAFQSVRIALAREQAVEPRFRDAAVTAVAQQAFLFCRSWYIDPRFRGEKRWLRACRGYVRKHLATLFRDTELSAAMKIKLAVLAFGGYGLLMALRPDAV